MGKTNRGNIWKPLLIIAGIVVFLAAILVGVGVFIGYRAYKARVVTSPVEAERKAREIMNYNIPGGSKGMFAMDLTKEMGMKMAMVQSAGASPNIVLVLAEIPQAWTKDQAGAEQRMKDSTQSKEQLKVNRTLTVQETLCGEKVNVIEKDGTLDEKGKESPATSLEAFVKHKEKAYFVTVMAAGTAHEADAMAVFKTLGCKD